MLATCGCQRYEMVHTESSAWRWVRTAVGTAPDGLGDLTEAGTDVRESGVMMVRDVASLVLAPLAQVSAAELPQIVSSVHPSSANSAARNGASPTAKNSSSCGGLTDVPLSMVWAWPRWCT